MINLNYCNYILLLIIGEIFKTLLRSYSILKNLRTKWIKKLVPHGRFSKIYYFEENKILSKTPT